MADLTESVIEDPRWEAAGLAALAERAARATLARLGLPSEAFGIAVLGADDARIARLNADFRGKPQPTNVLSWPADDLSPDEDGAVPHRPDPGPPDDPAHLGDIALAWETCAAEAEAAGKSLADHATHLIVHATLHLLGYDHQTEGAANLMEGIEIEILASMGLGNPY